ncbi:MAG TPA: NAD(P)-dependent oxidoreductase [Flavipsychrobacter sp.]|nr:NAD(P)-dependent oxidoreductase [Flavipsychrobacter sp.]
MNRQVLIAAPVHSILTRWLEANGYECLVREKITQQEAMAVVGGCAGIITSTRLQIDRALIDAAPLLQWIGRMGSGMEVIDLPYAVKKGIACYSSPEGNSNAVAEHALGMLLSLAGKIIKSNLEVKSGLWLREENRGVELEGKTIGIIGYGHTGSSFARKLYGFDVNVMVYDKYLSGVVPKYMEECKSLDRIFEEADIVSFHVPLQHDTLHYLNHDFIGKMKKPFILINTSRGKVVDTKALYDGLLSGKVSGACLDVWEEEPIAAMSSEMRSYLDNIATLPQVIITPHIAGYSVEALYKMSKALLGKIVMKQ